MTTWRPLRRNWADEDRMPRHIRESLDAVSSRLRLADTSALGAIFGRWEEAVGPAIAAHSKPQSLNRGTLVVAVDDSVWATQLRFLSGRLLEQLEAAAGAGVVTAIEVRVRRF